MQFETPFFLLLLIILLPMTAWLGWPSDGASHRREALNLLLRMVTVICLVFSLAGFDLIQPTNNLAVVFLLDLSDSIPILAQTAELAYVRSAMKNMGQNDQAAVVVFGGNALVERSMLAEKKIDEISSIPEKGQTNIEDAIRLGISLYPAQAARRMVILTDGNSTQGDSMAAARLAAGSGIQLETIPVGGAPGAEAMITRLDVPKYLQVGEHFDLTVDLNSNQAMNGKIRVLVDDRVVYNGSQKLEKGDQSFSLPLVADKAGFSRFQVQLDPEKDTFYQNNSLSAFSQITGIPRILVAAQPVQASTNSGSGTAFDEAAPLINALQSSQLSIERVDPAGIPSNLEGLAGYSTVILVDVPATALQQNQMQALQSYVRDLGGGLVAVGGTTSFGAGGYYRTPLEDMLPVSIQIQKDTQAPTVAMVFIIDKSGSMDELSNGRSKLDLAKEATQKAIGMLNPWDRVGVITFDNTASWAVPMTDLSNLQNVQNAIQGIQSGGGTNILSGLQAISASLSKDPAKIKHAILLTDGAGDPNGLTDLVQQLHQNDGITLTTIGLGNEAAPFLPQLAQIGGGRYYFSNDPAHIPELFSQETALASHSYLIEHRFTPQQANTSPILNGIDVKTMPALLGYVGTTAKENSQKILVSDLGDPILSTWQYGLGRSAAFTSDASGHWGQEWVNWSAYATFWAQLTRFTTREQTPSLLEARVDQGQGSPSTLIVDGQSEKGAPLNGYQVLAHISAADGSTQVVNLTQIAPGQYSSPFDTLQTGGYIISLQGTPPQGSGQVSAQTTTGWVMPYSDEYRNISGDGHLLEQIAVVGNGSKMTLDDTSAQSVFVHNLTGGQVNLPTWPWLVGIALILLPLDITLRRLLIRPEDIKDALKRSLGLQPRQFERASAGRLKTLMQVKHNLQETYSKQVSEVVSRRMVKPATISIPQPPQVKQAVVPPRRVSPKIPTKTAASLLAAKRNRDKDPS